MTYTYPPIAIVNSIRNHDDFVTMVLFERRDILEEIDARCARSDVIKGDLSLGCIRCRLFGASKNDGEAFLPSLPRAGEGEG